MVNGHNHSPPALTGRPRASSRPPFFRSLATLVQAGVTLSRTLHVLSVQAEDKVMRSVCEHLERDLNEGHSLSGAAARHPRAFTNFHLQLLTVGEQTGTLVASLDRLADYEEKQQRQAMELQRSLTYPLVLLALCLAAVVVGPPYLMAGHFQMARETGVPLPWLSRMMMALSTLVRQGWLWLGVALVAPALGAGATRAWSRPGVRRALAEQALRQRLAGRLLRYLAVSRFAQALSVQLEVGILLTQALPLAGAAAGFPGLNERIQSSSEALLGGATLAEALREARFFPPGFVRMVEAGEASGTVSKAIAWVGRFYEMEVETALESFLAFLEPVVLMVMGLVVAITLLATMLPMVSALEAL